MSTPRKRSVLLGLSAAYMLVQISSLPIALSLPSLADYFDTGLDDAAWIIIAYLVMVGSLVLLAARLGDRFGHINVFFAGMVVAFVASAPMALSQELWQLVVWRGLTGVGAALIMGNANAVLAATFSPGPAREGVLHTDNRRPVRHTYRAGLLRRVPALLQLAPGLCRVRPNRTGRDDRDAADAQVPGTGPDPRE